MKKWFLSFLLTGVLALQILPAGAAPVGDAVILNESFNSLVSNQRTELGAANVSGTSGKIVEKSAGDKALWIAESDSSSKTVSAAFASGTTGAEFIYSMDIMRSRESQSLSATIGLSGATTKYPAVLIEDNVMRLADGKNVGGITAAGYTNITLLYNTSAKVLTVYVNGKKAVEGWPFNNIGSIYSSAYITSPASGGSFYLDNIRLYQGREPRELPVQSYNPSAVDDVYIDEDPSDFTYFRSESVMTAAKNYYNYTATPKSGNSIQAERFDYRNPERGSDIVFVKGSPSNDCYIDITTVKPTQWESSRTYQYFYLAAEVWMENEDMDGNFFVIRDKEAEGQPLSYLLRSDGSTLTTNSGKRYAGKLKPQTWTTLEIYLDLEAGGADIYVGGVPLEAGVSFNSLTKKLGMVRIGLQNSSGLGTMRLRNVEVTGLVKKPKDAVIERTSVYGDTSAITEYLSSKVSFHHYSEIIYKDGVKTPLTDVGVYENDELYVSEADLKTAFGVDFTYEPSTGIVTLDGRKTELGTAAVYNEAGVLLLPAKAFGEKALSKYVLDDGYGMVIFSDEEMYWDLESEVPHYMQEYVVGHFTRPSVIQQMNAYLTFQRPTAGEIQTAFNKTTGNGEMHPRLMGTREDFENILVQAESDPVLKRLIGQVVSQADAIIPKEPVYYHYNDDYRTWNMAFQFMRQMEQLGLAYQLTGEQKYADRAWLDIESVCGFPDLNEAHAIDCGMYMTGLAFGYDWLYHALTEEQRAVVSEATLRMGIEVMDRAFYMGLPGGAIYSSTQESMQATSYFTKWRSNYVPYITVGLIGAGLAFAEESPEVCFDLIEKSLRATEYAMFGLVPDGAWIEGVDYWEVTVGNTCRLMSFLQTSTGTDYDLWKCQGFRESARAKASEESFHGSIAHSDATQNGGAVTSYCYPWYAKVLGQNDLAALRQLYLQGDFATQYGLSTPLVLGLDILYYTKADLSDAANFPKVQTFRGLESFSVRENYADPASFFFFSQAGQAFHYHGHNDCGAFAFEMDDVRWAIDLGKDDYGLNQTGKYYLVYRKRTEGHNTLTINNNDGWNQKEDEYAALIRCEEGDGGAYAVYDMSDLYRDASSVRRGFYIDEDYSVLTVRDEIELTKDSEVWWFMHTQADIEILDETTALLTQDGKSLMMQFVTDCPDFELSAMDAVPLPGPSAAEGQNANKGIRKVALKLTGSGSMNITVRMSTQGSGVVMDTPISQWQRPSASDGAKHDFGYQLYVDGKLMKDPSVIPVLDEQNLPQWRVVPNDPSMQVVVESDPKKAGEKVSLTLQSADGTVFSPKRLTYATASEALLDFFTVHVPVAANASEEPEPVNNAANLTDRNLSTKWCGKSEGAYVVLDYGELLSFDTMSIAYWKGDERQYTSEIYASADGENYTLVDTLVSDGKSDSYALYRLGKTVTARYIKLVSGGSTANKYTNPTEILILQ